MLTSKLFTKRTRHAHCATDVAVGKLFGATVRISAPTPERPNVKPSVTITMFRNGVYTAIVWHQYGDKVCRTAHVRQGRKTLLHEVKEYTAS